MDPEDLQEQVSRLLRKEQEQRLQQQVYEFLTPPPQSASHLHPTGGAKGKMGWPVQKPGGEGGGGIGSLQPRGGLEPMTGTPSMQKQIVVQATTWQLPMEPVSEQEERPEMSPMATPRQLEVHTGARELVLVCLPACFIFFAREVRRVRCEGEGGYVAVSAVTSWQQGAREVNF